MEVARAVRGPLAAALVMGCVVVAVRLGLAETGVGAWLRLLVATIVGVVAYAVALRWAAPGVFDRIDSSLRSRVSSSLASPALHG